MNENEVVTYESLDFHGKTNELQSAIKCDIDEEASEIVTKKEFHSYNNEICVIERSIESTSSGNNKSFFRRIIEEFLICEQNYATKDQLKNETKEKIESQGHSIDALFEEETEFPNIQEIEDTIDPLILVKGKIQNNNAEEFKQCSRKVAKGSFKGLSVNESEKGINIQHRNQAERKNLRVEQFQCHLCEHRATQEHHLRSHIEYMHFNFKRYKCSLCDFSGISLNAVMNHLNEVHPDDDSDEVHSSSYKFKCDMCGRKFHDGAELASHESNVHSTDCKRLKCKLCDYSSSMRIQLQKHVVSVHEKKKKFECSCCDYRSYYKSAVKKHEQAVHLKVKNLKCQICCYATNNKNRLASHVAAIHLDSKRFKCSFCDYASCRQDTFNDHLGIVHLRQISYECSLCDFKATTEYRIELHKRHAHRKKEKCELCAFETFRKSGLTAHVNNIHLKLRNFKCDLCDYATFRKKTLKSHVESVH